ncbi:MAG: outer membrane beta-barrel protein, partial [Saprospiraceae bacterium]|nr:outer membrane beta-barrel protein [Saprospiraceae bacterium]
MKKLFYTTLCMLIPVLSFCQFNSSIDLAVGLDYSYRNLSTSETDEIHNTIIEIRKQERAKTGLRFGFNYNKRLAKKLVFKTGLRYASKGYKSEKKGGLRYESEYATGVYVLDPSLVHEYQYVYNYWFLELPLAVRFELSKKKFSPYIETGLS